MVRLIAPLLFLATTSLVAAQPAQSVHLEELTWTELRDEIRAGKTTILVPIGGTEQSGPHMVLGKHNVRARVLAERIAQGLGDALVAPVVAYVPEGAIDPPTRHMRFPGTITVPEQVFERTLESAARSFRRHGFNHIVFLGDHGGYAKSLHAVARRLDREWARQPVQAVRVHVATAYYTAATEGFAALLRAEGYSAAEIGSHAGLADTALAMDIDPRLVRIDRLSSAAGARSGVSGDPSGARAELGRKGNRLIVERTTAEIRGARRP